MRKMTVTTVCILTAFFTTASLGAAQSPNPDRAGAVTEASFDYKAYSAAMQESGRNIGGITEKDFAALKVRKAQMIATITTYLQKRYGTANEAVINAFRQVPREYYMYDYQKGQNLGASAYEYPMREWPIGYGSTLSDYIVQAYMTQALDPKPT